MGDEHRDLELKHASATAFLNWGLMLWWIMTMIWNSLRVVDASWWMAGWSALLRFMLLSILKSIDQDQDYFCSASYDVISSFETLVNIGAH